MCFMERKRGGMGAEIRQGPLLLPEAWTQPRANVIKLFCPLFINFRAKLECLLE